MAWDVEVSDEFREWYEELTPEEQDSVTYSVDLLRHGGPSLGRPHVDTVKGSRHPNMKELRVQHRGRPWRVFFAFDPRRMAFLILAGDKSGDLGTLTSYQFGGRRDLRPAFARDHVTKERTKRWLTNGKT